MDIVFGSREVQLLKLCLQDERMHFYRSIYNPVQYEKPIPIGRTDVQYLSNSRFSWNQSICSSLYLHKPSNRSHFSFETNRCALSDRESARNVLYADNKHKTIYLKETEKTPNK